MQYIFDFLNSLSEAWKTALATLTVGLLVFIATMLTLIFSTRNSRLNYNFLLQKDKAEKQKSYNKVLGSFLKVYHSYLKHNLLFKEEKQKIKPNKKQVALFGYIFFSSIFKNLLLFQNISGNHYLLNLCGSFPNST